MSQSGCQEITIVQTIKFGRANRDNEESHPRKSLL